MPSPAPVAPPTSTALAILMATGIGLSFFLGLGAYPLFDVDEGAFSGATLEMFQRGDFLSTTLNGAPRYDKPILVYWLQAAAVAALGVNEWAFRLPSALCAALWTALVFFFVRRYYGAPTASLAAGALATCVAVCIVGRMATADALLNMLIAASMLSAWLYLDTGRMRWLYASFAAAGLGFLAKGPVSILIPFAVTLAFCLLRRDFATWRRAALHPGGWLTFAAIALPWYAFTAYRDGWAFAEGFFLKHNLGRFTSPMQGHAGSPFYYLPVLLIGTLPFTAWLVRVFIRLRSVWRNDLQLYLLLWFGFVFLFFSAAATKLPHYLVYGLTGLVILMALHGRTLRSRFWTLAPALVFFLGLLVLPWLLQFAEARIGDPYYREALSGLSASFGLAYFSFTLAAALATVWLMFEPNIDLPAKLLALACASVAAIGAFIFPILAENLQEPVRQAALLAREHRDPVVTWRVNYPTFSVYYGRPTPSREPRPGDVVLTKAMRLAELPLPFEPLYSNKGVVLVRIAR